MAPSVSTTVAVKWTTQNTATQWMAPVCVEGAGMAANVKKTLMNVKDMIFVKKILTA